MYGEGKLYVSAFFLLCLIFLDSVCFFVLLWHKNQLINYILFYLIPFLQLTGGGYVCQKIEASSENNAASNHSSDCYVYTQKNIECSEKGSDAQVSTFSCCSHSKKKLIIIIKHCNIYAVHCEGRIVFS